MTVASASAERFDRRPTAVSGAAALVAGAVAMGLLAGTTAQRLALAATVVGAAAFALGGRRWQRDRGVVGAGLAVVGVLLAGAAAGYVATQPPEFVRRLELLPGLAGLVTLAAALLPVRFRWSRLLVDVGTGLLFVAVLTSGVARGASTTALLAAAAATILAWDAAENAVSIGGQIGAHGETDTGRAELVHVGVGWGVAAGGIAVALGVARLGVDDLPFAALVALLVAGVALALVTHR